LGGRARTCEVVPGGDIAGIARERSAEQASRLSAVAAREQELGEQTARLSGPGLERRSRAGGLDGSAAGGPRELGIPNPGRGDNER
jgi:hypothetical protein